jgi:hypothetical protein
LPSSKNDIVELDAARHRVAETPKVEIDRASIMAAQAAQGEALAGVAAATFERLTNAKPSADGFVTCGSSRVIACSLSSATMERACRVLDAIERAMPAVRVAVASQAGYRCFTVVADFKAYVRAEVLAEVGSS